MVLVGWANTYIAQDNTKITNNIVGQLQLSFQHVYGCPLLQQHEHPGLEFAHTSETVKLATCQRSVTKLVP